MKISETIRIFVETKKTKEGKPFKVFSTSFSTKNEDGSYINKSMEVRFNKENIPESATSKLLESKVYTLNVENAWLGVRAYNNAEGEEVKVFYLYVDKATIKEAKDINKSKNSDLPF